MRRSQPLFFDTLESISIDANKFEVLTSTVGYREKLIELIKNSTKRIYLTALYLQDDEAGQAILTEIYKAKQRHPEMDVKIFVDFSRAQRGLMGFPESIGNVRLYREYAQKYEHQVEVLGVPVKSKEVLGVLHLKGFVFDDTILYSGASLNNVYLQHETRYRIDRYHVIENPRLADSMVSFMKNYLAKSPAVKSLNEESIPSKKHLRPAIRSFKKNLKFGHYKIKASSKVTDQQVSVTPLLGFGGRRNLLNQAIYQLIKNAQEKVTIFTPYFNFPGKISKAIRRALKQGKSVNIVVGDKVANDFYIPEEKDFNRIGIVPYVYETNLRKFLKRNQQFINSGKLNVYLWRHDDNSYHLKGMNADDQLHLITGHNINPRAWSLDLENGLLIKDPNQLLKSQFDQEMSVILTHTNRVKHFEEIETINDYPDAAKKLMKNVKRAKLDSILNRLL